ncbi:helix-turn-helix domain-containing protein [Marinococcus sp. PL1-022]|uniref:TetR/AcrR family transcriptional regulator n=1 Tax=Marinococcus sp. PL1-022 TaxID=3095363 RepID=UPI0029C243B3|nr:helix-turn-helix domain-containing protein [Marinococcus sp. PL1-022]MDX6154535.1 helix-turn-helix domain-containing protein [Marinococcus sp. PL1-022]
MNNKKLTIIQEAIKLFSEKGIYATSIQEIADHSNVSKGTVYLYFSSKNDLILSSFQHTHEQMQRHIEHINEENLSAETKFYRSIHAYLKELQENRDMIIMNIREQSFIVDQQFFDLFQQTRAQSYEIDCKILLNMYGDAFAPYVFDGALLLESMRTSVSHLFLFDDTVLDVETLTWFVVRRMHELAYGMMQKEDTPLLQDSVFQLSRDSDPHQQQQRLRALLQEMQAVTTEISIPDTQKQEMNDILSFLLEEAQHTEIKTAVFKQLLLSFREYSGFSAPLQHIASLLNISFDQ